MTRIAFYVGSSQHLQARLLLACKLVEKALAQGLQVYIHTDQFSTSTRLDELLWTYSDLSFIPHALAPSTERGLKVLIGHDSEPPEPCELLINLSNETPSFFERFERMAEVLDQEETILVAGRKRYQTYRNHGYTLDYHQL
ncbi:DNA polymerase III subunit chi [Thiothrix eikelboomii]|uniref:DNA polymerase III, chi subunit n=1 Tax=Thiothrix eikelboomii TaxID=92487 RepID=A0A1T4WAA1_9GAMM|nr:DNA polymerase III subunit chi [Thiothrix eikelboomii]SKA73631.1 DNA polymerase III, chi subunit [Thiothrix eikelboomii]